jgi:hypothetical protein
MKTLLKIFLITILNSNFLLSQTPEKIALLLPSELKEPDSSSSNMMNDLTTLELFLMQNKISYTVLYTDDLEECEFQNIDVLVLPFSFDLSRESSDILKSWLSKGLGLLSFGSHNIYDEDQMNLFNELCDVEFMTNSGLTKHTINQIFNSDIQQYPPFENFELLLNSKDVKLFYKTDNQKTYSFGCLNGERDFTTSFYGFVGAGRLAHFGFSFSKLLSSKEDIGKFENLILKSIDWLRKDSGIWIENAKFAEKQFLAVVDLSKGIINSERIITKLLDKNYPVLLVSEELEKIEKYSPVYKQKIYYGLKINCDVSSDSIIQMLRKVSHQIEFLLINNNDCIDERDIKKYSFEGIRNILIANKSYKKFYPLYNILITSFNDFNAFNCSSEKLFLADIYNKIDCEQNNVNDKLQSLRKLSENINPFNRELLINDFKISSLNTDYTEKRNSLEIKIQNPFDSELKDLVLVVEKKLLSHKIVYDIKIDGKSYYFEKETGQDNFKVKINSINPKSTTVIEIFFENII